MFKIRNQWYELKKYPFALKVRQLYSEYEDKTGIYCMKIDGQIIYIGSSRDLCNRLTRHAYNINRVLKGEIEAGVRQKHWKYFEMANACKEQRLVEFEIMEIIDSNINDVDLETIEYSLINQYKPQGNVRMKQPVRRSCR